MQRLIALAQKEFIQIRRDRRTLAMMILLPVLWLLMFGYAFSFDVNELKVAVVDQSGTPVGAATADAFHSYDRFKMIAVSDPSEAGIRDGMQRDEVQMGVLIPKGYGDPGAAPATTPQMQVFIDGSDLFAAQTAARLIQPALEPLQSRMKAPTAPAQMLPQMTILYNPGLKSAPVMIPGLLGLVMMFMTTMMTAMGVVRERENGTMEQLVVTPIRPIELMLGKLLPYFLVGAVDFAVVYIAGVWLFDLTFAGNLPVFLGLSLLLVFTTLGMGLLISTLAQNQQQAMQLTMFTVMPQILVSGFIFPLASLPKAIQYIAYALPLTHYVPIARGMFIKGQGLDHLWPQAVILAGYAVVVIAVASLRFRKRIA